MDGLLEQLGDVGRGARGGLFDLLAAAEAVGDDELGGVEVAHRENHRPIGGNGVRPGRLEVVGIVDPDALQTRGFAYPA